jgi:hypothetical protein
MMNYHGGQPLGPQSVALFEKYRDRYVGSISGEGLGYFYPLAADMQTATARLFAHLTRGLMPIEVDGDVQWLVNRTADGWLVTLLNPAGQAKPQHGITPTDYRENREVRIRARVPVQTARDRLQTDDPLSVQNQHLHLIVPAGAVRIIELK